MIGCILFSVLLSVKMGVGRRGGFLQIEEVFDVFEDWERDKISFERRYSKLREIGNGASSTVYLGQERGTDRFVAIKEVKIDTLSQNESLLREVDLLYSISHKGVVQLFDVFRTSGELLIVLELVQGPELFDLICEQKTFSEMVARKIIRQLTETLYSLHGLGIVHRDLKPENILVVETDCGCGGADDGCACFENLEVKLIDFGLSSTESPSSAGTLGYKAPELFRNQQQYDGSCDMWALGVISYILFHGFPPFFSEEDFNEDNFKQNAPFWFFFNTETEFFRRSVCEGKIEFGEGLSREGRDFIGSLLEKDPSRRMTAGEALSHPWLNSH